MASALRVSVIIPVYNRAELVKCTLKSVLDQQFDGFEVVVVDDGSADGTAAHVRQQFPHVRVFEQENKGASGARNTGARHALGEVLVFFDSDDVMLPDALTTLWGLLQRFPEARAAYTDNRLEVAGSAETLANHHYQVESFRRFHDIPVARRDGNARLFAAGAMYRPLLRGNLLQQPWAIYRRDFLQLGGFDESIRLCEDWELSLRVAAAIPHVVSDDIASIHMQDPTQPHMSRVAGQEEMQLRVLRKHLRRNRFKDPAAWALIRRRIAMYYKTFGDTQVKQNLRRAWQCYVRSAAWWPFDHVVLARCVAWAPGALRTIQRYVFC